MWSHACCSWAQNCASSSAISWAACSVCTDHTSATKLPACPGEVWSKEAWRGSSAHTSPPCIHCHAVDWCGALVCTTAAIAVWSYAVWVNSTPAIWRLALRAPSQITVSTAGWGADSNVMSGAKDTAVSSKVSSAAASTIHANASACRLAASNCTRPAPAFVRALLVARIWVSAWVSALASASGGLSSRSPCTRICCTAQACCGQARRPVSAARDAALSAKARMSACAVAAECTGTGDCTSPTRIRLRASSKAKVLPTTPEPRIQISIAIAPL